MRTWLILLLYLPWIAHSRCAIEGLYQPKSDSYKVAYLYIQSDGAFEFRDSLGALQASGKVEEMSPAIWDVQSSSIEGPLKQKSKTIELSGVEYAKVPKAERRKVLALFADMPEAGQDVAKAERASTQTSESAGSSEKSETPWLWIALGAAAAVILLVVATQ